MKKPAAVAAAEEALKKALKTKANELASAKEAVQRLEREYADAVVAVRKASEEADSDLPQCRLVQVRWLNAKEEDMGRAAILRKTPSGMLVVRRVGDDSGQEYRFKWRKLSGSYTQAEKATSPYSDLRELRDVPTAFMPTGQTA